MDDLDIDEAPTSIEPYQILGLEKEATADQVKTAYRKAALKHHPDKAAPSEKEAANTKFQEIAFAYAILSDERRRRRYDLTGRTEESLDLDDDDAFDWISFYRDQFANVITGDTIAQFTQEYKGSDEEREAILKAYEDGKGSMDRVYATVMTSNAATDDERFRRIINEAIAADDVESFDKFTKESQKSIKKRIENAQKDGKEAEAYAKKIGVHDKLFGKGKGKKSGSGATADEGGLAALIQQRQKGRQENFMADLEAKYAPAAKAKKGKKRAEPMDEPPEEAFTQNAERLKRAKEDRGETLDAVAGARKSKRVKS